MPGVFNLGIPVTNIAYRLGLIKQWHFDLYRYEATEIIVL